VTGVRLATTALQAATALVAHESTDSSRLTAVRAIALLVKFSGATATGAAAGSADPAAPGAQDGPAIGGVRAFIAQHDPSMATMFEVRHLDHDPSCPDVPRGFAIAPAVEPIIVDGVPIVDPQLGSVIGNEREPVTA